MDAKQKGKLERYFKNASRFLWGLGNGNQKETYRWLKSYGKQRLGSDFDFKEGPYREVIAQLLQNPGIERLLKDLVVPRVRELFSDQALEFLQRILECRHSSGYLLPETLQYKHEKTPAPSWK